MIELKDKAKVDAMTPGVCITCANLTQGEEPGTLACGKGFARPVSDCPIWEKYSGPAS